MVYKQRSEAIV